MPAQSQNRHRLSAPLSQHDQRDAATLVAAQLTEVLTESQEFPDNKDTAMCDATDADVEMSLPLGSEDIIGLPWVAYKVDSSANEVKLVCSGDDEFADASTEIGTTTEGASIGAMWDGTVWRQLAAPVSSGAFEATTVASTGAMTAGTTLTVGTSASVGTTLAVGTGATIGGETTGTAAAFMNMNKTAAGEGGARVKAANTLRGELLLDGSEKFILRNYAADGTTVLGSLTFDNASGLLTSLLGVVITAGGLTITAGGLTVTAGGASIVAGNLSLTAGVRAVLNAPAAADDAAAAALSPTVPVGGAYHVSGALKQRLV